MRADLRLASLTLRERIGSRSEYRGINTATSVPNAARHCRNKFTLLRFCVRRSRLAPILNATTQSLWAAAVIATVLALARLWQQGLVTARYRILAAFLTCDVVESIILFFVPADTTLYVVVPLAFKQVRWALRLGMLCEICRLALLHYRGIVRLTICVLQIALVIAIVGALCPLFLEYNRIAPAPELTTFRILERILATATGLFLCLILVFVKIYPIPVCENLLRYALGVIAISAGEALAIFVINIGGIQWTDVSTRSLLVVRIGCLCWWSLGMSMDGERMQRPVHTDAETLTADDIVCQLYAVNTALLSSIRQDPVRVSQGVRGTP